MFSFAFGLNGEISTIFSLSLKYILCEKLNCYSALLPPLLAISFVSYYGGRKCLDEENVKHGDIS